jgi:hypothetical protein
MVARKPQQTRHFAEHRIPGLLDLGLRLGAWIAQAQVRVVGRMGTELEFVIMVIAVSCVKLLSAHNSTQHTSRKHKV